MTEWQPIESAPKDGTRILAGYFDDVGDWRNAVIRWKDERWYAGRVKDAAGNVIEIKHTRAKFWQPLPAPPPRPKRSW